VVGAWLLWGMILLPWAAADQPSRRPNVLLITSDDLNRRLGCYGNPLIQTPNIDRLAARGLRFEHAYCQYAVCNPSRTSFLTGLRPSTVRVYANHDDFRKTTPNAVTLPELFKQQGYLTVRVGKIFHQDVPHDIGTSGLDDPKSWSRVINPLGRDKEDNGGFKTGDKDGPAKARLLRSGYACGGTDEEQTDGKTALEAVQLLEKNRDKPFFIAVGFYRPHTPFIAPKKYFDMYPIEKIKLPDVPADDRADIPEAALWVQPPNFGLNDTECRQAIRSYYACVSFMDAQLGRILDALDRLRLWDNTVVVFLGDHGYHLGEHFVWLKGSVFEESAGAPLIIAAPGGGFAGRSTPGIVEFLDLYPTLADLSGLTPPANLQGKSLRPLLEDPQRAWSAPGYTEYRGHDMTGYSVRTDRWRYTEWDEGKKGTELYDHQKDPRELRNLARDPQYAGVIRELTQLLQKIKR